MKISIITVVLNNKDTIADTIDSVLGQSYEDIEYIIVDGKSSDGTAAIISSYKDRIDKFISEADSGIYYAMNKGIAQATGEVVGILNSDDCYADKNVIAKIAATLQKNPIDSVYGDLDFVCRAKPHKIMRIWRSKPYHSGLFQRGWHPAHPTFFVRRKIYQQCGVFNTDFKIAADYELLLRFFVCCNITSLYIPCVLVKQKLGGASNKNIGNIIKANVESYRAWGANGITTSPFIFAKKPLSKLRQYLFRFNPNL